MTDKLELKSCHEVIDTVDVANIESIFHGKPIDPDILTVVMKDGKRLYCDEVCPVDSLQEEPISEDLDEAADNCYFHNHAWARESFIEGANWQKEKDDKLFTIVYMDGVEKGKQQMMKDSISATIESDLDPIWAFCGKQKIVCKWGELEAKKFKEGTKVKLIIIKED